MAPTQCRWARHLLERTVMGRLGDAEEVVVVASLLTCVLDHEGIVVCVERGESDATDVLIQSVFQRADAALGVLCGLAPGGRRRSLA
jgi:hypothetical protein